MKHLVLAAAAALALATSVEGACVNKFLNRSEGPRQVVTLLTGKLTFQEAQKLAAEIAERKAAPVEWVEEKGATVAKQLGALKVVRPMPVGCDGKESGVVIIATFPTMRKPSGVMKIKFDEQTTVDFQQQ